MTKSCWSIHISNDFPLLQFLTPLEHDFLESGSLINMQLDINRWSKTHIYIFHNLELPTQLSKMMEMFAFVELRMAQNKSKVHV